MVDHEDQKESVEQRGRKSLALESEKSPFLSIHQRRNRKNEVQECEGLHQLFPHNRILKKEIKSRKRIIFKNLALPGDTRNALARRK